MEIVTVKIKKSDDLNVIIGQSHFIKTAEDIYEAIVNSVPLVKFAVGFSEASGVCKIRLEGNDRELLKLAEDNLLAVSCGHVFIVFLKAAYPVNVLNAIKMVPEVCNIYCASANPIEVILAQTDSGRGILGVIDGLPPKGVETKEEKQSRKDLLRKIGYKL
ncbi:MAG: adenosine-specific kinase [Candidatus Omnitrophica bacterium]|jgi:hypothetical protein|nr:adenosine-specific kinase [Candidatus Omnitrophota bacterium]